MSYYPPGVTGNEPQIAGDYDHYAGCPMYAPGHKCEETWPSNVAVEWDDAWQLVVLRPAHTIPFYVDIAFCPFCGDDLPAIHCECDEIADALWEKAQEEKKLGNQ